MMSTDEYFPQVLAKQMHTHLEANAGMHISALLVGAFDQEGLYGTSIEVLSGSGPLARARVG